MAPASALCEREKLCDPVVCLITPEPFCAVGAHYAEFGQTSDAEVVGLLAEIRP